MRKLIVLFLLILSLVLNSCGQNCTTGMVVEKSIQGDKYYLILEIENPPLIKTGDTKSIEVEKGFYYSTAINHLVTICE